MSVLELEFEVYCTCGNGLCQNTTESSNRHSQYITVEPCEKCLDAKEAEGYGRGYDEGFAECEKETKDYIG